VYVSIVIYGTFLVLSKPESQGMKGCDLFHRMSVGLFIRKEELERWV